jgi:hypothetical protein
VCLCSRWCTPVGGYAGVTGGAENVAGTFGCGSGGRADEQQQGHRHRIDQLSAGRAAYIAAAAAQQQQPA